MSIVIAIKIQMKNHTMKRKGKSFPFPPPLSLSLVFWLPLKATQGPCNTPKPGMLDFVNKAKWEAWSSLGATSQVATAVANT